MEVVPFSLLEETLIPQRPKDSTAVCTWFPGVMALGLEAKERDYIPRELRALKNVSRNQEQLTGVSGEGQRLTARESFIPQGLLVQAMQFHTVVRGLGDAASWFLEARERKGTHQPRHPYYNYCPGWERGGRLPGRCVYPRETHAPEKLVRGTSMVTDSSVVVLHRPGWRWELL